MSVVCKTCGAPIKYINAAHSVDPEGIFIVDEKPQILVSERGRLISGYTEHRCPPKDVGAGDKGNG
ncbi:hypothetical protein FACS189447_03180 [Spirochaetia bacterium]|nr:hypothetical protein FACS189447_03180 [Spirochaetia bacterium]